MLTDENTFVPSESHKHCGAGSQQPLVANMQFVACAAHYDYDEVTDELYSSDLRSVYRATHR